MHVPLPLTIYLER